MDVTKSSRHSKITGDFAESLVLYWLSKYGFECAQVDHTGIDLIARNPTSGELMGISVKSRSRNTGKEKTHVRVDSPEGFEKVRAACQAFGCVPYFAIVVDASTTISCFILSMDHLLELHPLGQGSCGWSMRPAWLRRYETDPEVRIFRFESETVRWWDRPGKGPGDV